MRVKARFYFLSALLLLILSYQTFPQTNISSKQNSIYNPPTFENITVKDGLPENTVPSILQDYLGYLWIGTQNGLVRYDGYTMKVFQLERDYSDKLNRKMIITIFQDKYNTLWVGTWKSGLFKFNREYDSFKSYEYDPGDTRSINSNNIQCIYEDNNGKFWVGTTVGLNLFDRDSQIFTRYYFGDGDTLSHSATMSDHYNLCIHSIIEDPVSGDLLIGTARDGLWRFNPEKKYFINTSSATAIIMIKK